MNVHEAADAGLFKGPSSDADPFSADFFDNPFPIHHSLREAGPVVWLNRYGVPAVARYAEVSAVLSDWKNFSSASGVGYTNTKTENTWRPQSKLVENDPPDHTRLRAIMQRILSATAMKRLKGRFAAAAEAIVDVAVKRGEIDGVSDLAQAYPLAVFPDALGMGEGAEEHALPYARIVFNAFGPDNEFSRRALAGAGPHVEWVMAHCRSSMSENGFGGEVFAAVQAGELEEDEAILLIRSLFGAGLDTTISGIAGSLVNLARRPDQWQILKKDHGLARAVFEEAVRLESPIQSLFRTTHEHGAEIAGVRISPNTKLMVFVASANRDPRRWENPDEFNITRRVGGHVGFGFGIHMCVGQLLARLEVESLLTALAAKVDKIELIGEPVQTHNNTLRSLDRLPLRLSTVN
jgi:4-methoxybenzoate monooxygenase (O-demethylating)